MAACRNETEKWGTNRGGGRGIIDRHHKKTGGKPPAAPRQRFGGTSDSGSVPVLG